MQVQVVISVDTQAFKMAQEKKSHVSSLQTLIEEMPAMSLLHYNPLSP